MGDNTDFDRIYELNSYLIWFQIILIAVQGNKTFFYRVIISY